VKQISSSVPVQIAAEKLCSQPTLEAPDAHAAILAKPHHSIKNEIFYYWSK
jgi:hypothetical protein